MQQGPIELYGQAEDFLAKCRARKWKLAVAESCTGGLISALLTSIPGSSDVFERGFITYSNESKVDMLGVDAGTIKTFGAVSGQVAQGMAAGAIVHSRADVALAVTGIAGPGGGSPDKPVGTVWIGVATAAECNVESFLFTGSREEIRLAAMRESLVLGYKMLI